MANFQILQKEMVPFTSSVLQLSKNFDLLPADKKDYILKVMTP